MKSAHARLAAAALSMAAVVGCATTPQPVTKIVGGKVIVTRAVSPEAYEHSARALMYEQEERYAEAAAELQRALPFDDEAAEPRAHLAELFVRLGRLDDAAEQIDRSLQIAPTVDGYLASAHLNQARGDGARTLDALRNAVGLAIADDDAELVERAHLELSEAQVVALDVPGALETARQLVESAPDSLRGRVQLAALAWSLGRLDEGEAALKEALAQEPADLDARVLLAELQVAAGRIPAAKASFRDAIERADVPLEIAGGFAGWLMQRGDGAEAVELADRLTSDAATIDTLALASALERAVKRPERARALADRAQKLGATPARVALLQGEALAAGGDHAGAVAQYASVPRDASEYVEARARAAELLRDDGKLDEAARLLDQALALATERDASTPLAIARSMVEEKRGDAVRAARLLDDAIAKQPTEARLLLARAGLEERRGEWRRAVDIAEKLLAREPRNVEALNFLGFVAADHGFDLPRATRRLQAAVALSPGSGGIVDSLGWVYFKTGDLPQATTFLEQAGRLEPGDAEILEHLGDLYARTKNRDQALATYRRAMGLSPSERLSRDLAERVRTLEAKSAAGR
jgi:tetratricopeptide (TPR) repeat protein